jgi:hypothetical protein
MKLEGDQHLFLEDFADKKTATLKEFAAEETA